MEPGKKKELKAAYKDAPEIGGIYCVQCGGNRHKWIKSTRDIDSLQRRFAFAVSTRSCPDPAMRKEWSEYGIESFSLTVLEPLKKGELQSAKAFCDDLATLLALWLEKDNGDSVHAQRAESTNPEAR